MKTRLGIKLAVCFTAAVIAVTPCGIFADLRCGALTVSAQAAVLYDTESGTLLYEKSASERLPMASTTKIMTALVAAEMFGLSDRITVGREATLTEGSSMYLAEGDVLSVRDLLLGLLLTSGNDAAEVIASAADGGKADFVAAMNDRASALGLTDTSFRNPSGLPDEEHYTTAYELALMTEKMLENDFLASAVAMKSAKLENGRVIYNHNKLLSRCEYAVGVKTGYTKAAGRCLVSAARKDGALLICVTLAAPDDWNDHIKLINHGFDDYQRVRVSEYLPCRELPVGGGVCGSVSLTVEETVLTIQNDKADNIRVEAYCERFVFAPVLSAASVGEIRIYCGGELMVSADILTQRAVDARRRTGGLSFFEYFILMYTKTSVT